MEKGIIVEQNKTSKVFNHPDHNYTKKLINAEPREKKLTKKQKQTILSVNNLSVFYKIKVAFSLKIKIKIFRPLIILVLKFRREKLWELLEKVDLERVLLRRH